MVVGGEITSGHLSGRGLVRLYDVHTTAVLAVWDEPKPVWACRLSPDLQLLAVAGCVCAYTHTQYRHTHTHTTCVYQVSVHPVSVCLYVCVYTYSICKHSVTNRPTGTLADGIERTGHTQYIFIHTFQVRVHPRAVRRAPPRVTANDRLYERGAKQARNRQRPCFHLDRGLLGRYIYMYRDRCRYIINIADKYT